MDSESKEAVESQAATESQADADVFTEATLSDGDPMGEEEIDAVYNTIFDMVGIDWLSDILTVLIAVAFTAVVAHLATKLLRRVLSHDNSPLPSSSIFINISRVVIWFIGASIILENRFDINMSNAITALGIGGIAISLGFQDTLSNLISGLQLSIMGLVQPGDHVDIGGQRGVVSDVTWRHTTIRNFTGDEIVVPNSVINKSTLVKLPPLSKIVVPISVTTEGRDMDAVAQAIQKAADASAEAITPVISPSVVLFTSITEFGFAGNVIVYVADGMQVNAVKDAIVRATALITRTYVGAGEAGGEGSAEEKSGEAE